MERILKYLIPVFLLAIALIGDAEEPGLANTGGPAYVSSLQSADSYLDSSASCSDIYLPRIVSGASVLHVQGATAKRTCNSYRNNIEFVRLGKIVNTGIRNQIQKETLNILYPFTEPAHRLICLGKLII